ncbi:sulfite exporter TauE/SafE family protein [Desulfotomaculum defluvii]
MPGDLTIWLASALIILLAATLQGITGFGFALISVPLLLLVYEPHTAVGINIMISIVSLSFLTFKVRQVIMVPVVKNLFLGSLLGIPLGVYIFLYFDMHLLKLSISIVTAIFSLILISGITLKNVKGKIWESTVGSLSGFLTGSIGMPGPPIILFLSNQKLPKDRFRATTAAYFVLVYMSSLILLFCLGAIDKSVALTAISLVPFALLGGHLGYLIFPLVPQAKFQHGVSMLVLSTALYSVISTIW